MEKNLNNTYLEASQANVPPLRQLYFYLTEGCNLACRHCWLAPKYDPTGSHYAILPVEAFKKAIIEAKPLGLTGVKLTGGEPLLHPQFKALLEIVRREDLSLNIETNGVLCTPEIAAEIAKSPKRSVAVSIDSPNDSTHDGIRTVPGSLKKTKRAVLSLAEAGSPPQIIMSLMRCNFDQLEAMVHLAENLGASSVKFNVVQPTGRGKMIHNGEDRLEVSDLIELGRFVDTVLAPKTKLKLFFDYPLAFRPLSRIAGSDGCGICGIINILGVIPSGHYAICGIGEKISGLVFGRIGENPLEEVWRDSKPLKALRAGLPHRLRGVCARCLMKQHCLGCCVAQNYYRAGSLWAPFWFCEQAEALGLFPRSRLN